MTHAGTDVVTLHTFDADDGVQPVAPLIQTASTTISTERPAKGGANPAPPDAAGVPHERHRGPSHRARVRQTDGSGADRRADRGNRRQHLRRHRQWRHVGRRQRSIASIPWAASRPFTTSTVRTATSSSWPASSRRATACSTARPSSGGRFGFGHALSDGFRRERHGPCTISTAQQRPGRRPNRPTGSIVPRAELVEGADGKLYGVRVTRATGPGIVYRFTSRGNRAARSARTPSCGATRWRCSS